METNKELMRAEFEAWAKDRGFDTTIGPDGTNYLSGYTQSVWEPWQAALSQRSEAVPDVSWEDGFHNLLFALKVIAGAPSTCDDPVKAAQMFSTMPWVEALGALGIQQPAPAPSAAAGEQVPSDDVIALEMKLGAYKALNSQARDAMTRWHLEAKTLGFDGVADALASIGAQPTPAQSDAVPVDYSFKRIEGHGWYVDPPKHGRWVAFDGTPAGDLIAVLANRQSSTDAVGAELIHVATMQEMQDGFGKFPNTIWCEWNKERRRLPTGTKIYAIAAQGGKGGA